MDIQASSFKNSKVFGHFLFRYRFFWHLLFWTAFLLYETVVWGLVDGAYQQRLVTSFIELPLKIGAAYFTLYILIDKLLIKKEYGLFVFGLLLSMLAFGLMSRTIWYYILYPLYYPQGTTIPWLFLPKIIISVFAIYSITAILASFHLIRQWYADLQTTQFLKETTQQLEKEKLGAELKLLKSQINPHFLFNTLNNLYVMTLNNSSRAPEMIYKLSQLMDYMLYESNLPEVPLYKEIQYIENYITLEKIRYDERLDVSLNLYEQTEGIKIAPLLILPFVENSFKHGANNQISKVWIRIDILLKENVLTVKVENSKSYKDGQVLKSSSGLGLQNVAKRLELIYKDKYDLKIYDEEETYLVVLKIELVGQMIESMVVSQ